MAYKKTATKTPRKKYGQKAVRFAKRYGATTAKYGGRFVPKSSRRATATAYKKAKTTYRAGKTAYRAGKTAYRSGKTALKATRTAAKLLTAKRAQIHALTKMKDLGNKIGQVIKQKGTQLAIEAALRTAMK